MHYRWTYIKDTTDMSWNFQEKGKQFVIALTSHPLVVQSMDSLHGQDGSGFFFLSCVVLFRNLQCLGGKMRR